jgi:NTE family protein
MAGNETVAVVLSGGGARGAYEIGVLSALLPELEQRGERPRLIIGTSIGALNAAYLAATAQKPVKAVLEGAERAWLEISPRKIWRRPIGPRVVTRAAAYGAHVLGFHRGPWGLLDSRPVTTRIADIVEFDKLRANVRDGHVRVAVVTTFAFTSETVVFHAGGPSPPFDGKRGITYQATPDLGPEHVQASTAIPGAFPAVEITSPEAAQGWYFDGGVRLNTPIKPAISMGADRILVIGLNSIARGRLPEDDRRPDVLDGSGQIVQAMFADPLANDVHLLVHDNRMVAEARRGGVDLPDRRVIPYAFVSPELPDSIGRIAQRSFKDHYPWTRGALRGDELAVAGRLLGAGENPLHGELFSYLFFAPEFTRRLLELGKQDGQRWLQQAHDDGPWRIESEPPV